jgi:hypothetical protein
MFWSAEAKVSCNNLFALVTYENVSFVSPSTHLLCLHARNHSL